jgi:hypothetical protein
MCAHFAKTISSQFVLVRKIRTAAVFAVALATSGAAGYSNTSDGKWWSFRPVSKPAPPKVRNQHWIANDVDAFILAKLESKGLRPAPPAEKRTLIRRATLDLTGLLPSPEEIDAFVNDSSANAFQKVVDRLLASPQYGERWARHWLDLARYADSEGFKNDEPRPNIWRYRDYVINSFNADKPYDRFVREQIAGDELYPGDDHALIATGFHRHFPDDTDARDLLQRRQEILDDITDTVGATFLGLTYGCARCHDHKFDPIPQEDYYRLQAFFANVGARDNLVINAGGPNESELRQAKWEAKTRLIRDRMSRLVEPYRREIYDVAFKRFPPEVQNAVNTNPPKRTPLQWQIYYRSRVQLDVSTGDAAERMKSTLASVPGLADFRRVTEDGLEVEYSLIPRLTWVGWLFLGISSWLLLAWAWYRWNTQRPTLEAGRRRVAAIWRVSRYGLIAVTCMLIGSAATYITYVWNEVRWFWLKAELAKYDTLRPSAQPQLVQAVLDLGPVAPQTHVLAVGAYNSPLREVQPGFLSILDPRPAPVTPINGVTSTGRRAALANWIADPRNPLTGRVIVNRIWHYHFGRGIVATTSDLGRMGDRPSHPDLLDYLTAVFYEGAWSIKNLHRLILLSNTYQQSTAFNPEAYAIDPENELLWRYRRRRIEAESVRDTALQVSGMLNLKMGGPGVFPVLPQGLVVRYWKRNQDPAEENRRSIYVFVKRNTRYPIFEAFDAPIALASCARRYQTVSVTQSLELWNGEIFLKCARLFAERVLRKSESMEDSVAYAFRLAFGREPTAKEQNLAARFLNDQSRILMGRAADQPQRKASVKEILPLGIAQVWAEAFVDFCHVLLNSNEFLYLN